MGERHEDAIALLAKIGSGNYPTDPTPTGEANAILAKNCTIEPLLGTDIPRGLLRSFRGHQGIILAGHYAKITFDVEVAGSGTAGTAPAWGVLHRMCGLAETVVEVEETPTEVTYTKISTGYEWGSLYYFLDGVRHILLGARGKLTMPELSALTLPHWRYEMWGLLGTITDQAMPTADLDDFVDPVPLGDGNTTLSLHGVSLPAERFAIDFGNQVEPRFLLNDSSIRIIDHQVTGQAVLQADSIATKDWFGIAKAHTTGALGFAHGTVAGNIVEIDAATVQIGRPTYGASQKIVNQTLPLIMQAVDGGDDITVTVK